MDFSNFKGNKNRFNVEKNKNLKIIKKNQRNNRQKSHQPRAHREFQSCGDTFLAPRQSIPNPSSPNHNATNSKNRQRRRTNWRRSKSRTRYGSRKRTSLQPDRRDRRRTPEIESETSEADHVTSEDEIFASTKDSSRGRPRDRSSSCYGTVRTGSIEY